ncbi:MAG: TetR/AcrR family transcriptional regulator, partial [Sedimentitalea sp.]
SKATTVSRADREKAKIWIEGALRMIVQNGVSAVKVEPLARTLKVSKGSFYWFFRDIDDLLMRSLDHWKETLNDTVYEDIRTFQAPPRARLFLLVDRVLAQRMGRFDAAIRAWAMTDPRVQAFVTCVDAERLELLTEVFADSFAPAQARQRAHLFYRAFIAESYLAIYPGRMTKGVYLKELIVDLLGPDMNRNPRQTD